LLQTAATAATKTNNNNNSEKIGIKNPKISVNELAICFATLHKNAQDGGGRRQRGERRRRRGRRRSAGDANNNVMQKVAIGWQRERARAGSIMDRGI